jgi:GNAT superfamily N-acetyltransferase
MSRIRPVEREDLAQVTELYERTMRSGLGTPPPGLAAYFERTLLDHPWADPDLPSLVFQTVDKRILGFIGSHARHLQIDERPIRLGCTGSLVTDPHRRHLGIGARLLRTYLSGPQDLTITDGATDVVHEMWVRLGGYALYPGSVEWTRLFRPWRAIGDRWLEHRGKERVRRVVRPAWPVLDSATSRITRPPERPAGVDSEELTPRALIEHQAEVLGNARLRVDYDELFVEWLFHEMAAVPTRGTLVRRLLRQQDRLLGWYVAYVKPRELSEVIEVKATRGELGTVLDCLFADAWDSGADGVEGRLEPALYEPLSGRRCWLHYGARALFHSRDADVLAAISLGRSALTRLDGEYWMGHHTEPFQ